nr:uncharacterized protein LOC105865224 [Microcebus murinus]
MGRGVLERGESHHLHSPAVAIYPHGSKVTQRALKRREAVQVVVSQVFVAIMSPLTLLTQPTKTFGSPVFAGKHFPFPYSSSTFPFPAGTRFLHLPHSLLVFMVPGREEQRCLSSGGVETFLPHHAHDANLPPSFLKVLSETSVSQKCFVEPALALWPVSWRGRYRRTMGVGSPPPPLGPGSPGSCSLPRAQWWKPGARRGGRQRPGSERRCPGSAQPPRQAAAFACFPQSLQSVSNSAGNLRIVAQFGSTCVPSLRRGTSDTAATNAEDSEHTPPPPGYELQSKAAHRRKRTFFSDVLASMLKMSTKFPILFHNLCIYFNIKNF